MARKAVKLIADKETIKILDKWNKSEKIERRLYFRTQIILLCLKNKTNLETAIPAECLINTSLAFKRPDKKSRDAGI